MDDRLLAGPGHDPWTVAVFAPAEPRVPAGCGVLVDSRRVLTCRHVVEGKYGAGAPLTVTFPKAGVPKSIRAEVAEVRAARDEDVAVLMLANPAPPEATPAPLRAPRPIALRGDHWWAFGFPRESEFGADAHGVVGRDLAYGWIRLDTRSRYVVKAGFSGAGLWSRDFNAVVGLVGQAQRGGDHAGDALAITLHQAARELPDERLLELTAWSVAVAGETALEAWGWSLSTDLEAVRHWRPRARGVSTDTEGGYRFRGRTAALTEIVDWLRRPQPDTRVLVVTGSPGVGKSAVLGRVVTTADRGVRAALPADDRNVRAPIGSIACAVHAKGKTALDVAVEIARAASVRIPRTVDDLVSALRHGLSQDRGRGRRHFNLVVDALDEAANPKQGRLIVSALMLPIARTCSRYGAQVVVGSRRVDDGGELLRAFGSGTRLIDLDREEYFAEEDLRAYALATLALTGDERAGNPYADVAVAAPVAQRIAAMADRNFLIAGLIARSHGMYDTSPVDPDTLAFTATVDEALEEYLRRLPPVDRVPATTLLTALAYAQAPGMSLDLWRVALEALGVSVPREALVAFAGSSAANFLVESSNDAGMPRYRLFHQALNDALLRKRKDLRRADERALAERLIRHGRNAGWARADPYLLRSLPAYAAHAGMIDALLTDESYLLYADLPRLTPLAEHAVSPAGRARARLLRLTPQAMTAAPAERAALFGMTAELENLGDAFRAWRGVPYRARWASVAGRAERSVLEGHEGTVRAICPVTLSRQTHLATVGDYSFVRMWNPASGRHWEVPITGPAGTHGDAELLPAGPFFTVCALPAGDRTLLATAGRSGRIHLVDPLSRRPAGTMAGSAAIIRSLCVLHAGPVVYLVSGCDDGLIRMWNLTDSRTRICQGHVGPVRSVTVIRHRGRQLILSAGDDFTARIWDPATGEQLRIIKPHIDRVRAACPVTVNGRRSVATTNFIEAKVWDPASGMEAHTLAGHTKAIRGMTTIAVDGRELLATAADDGDIRIWDPVDGECVRVLSGHTDVITAICAVAVDGHPLLATASRDRTARVWDLAADDTGRSATRRIRVSAACAVHHSGRQVVATADDTTGVIRLQDVETGVELLRMDGRAESMQTMCTVSHARQELIAVAGGDRSVLQTWDVASGRKLLRDPRWFGRLQAICAFTAKDGSSLLAVAGNRRAVIQLYRPDNGRVMSRRRLPNMFLRDEISTHLPRIRVVHQVPGAGMPLLATAGEDMAIMLWNPDGRHQGSLYGHRGSVRALAAMPMRGQTLLASGSDDQTIRLWDPDELRCLGTLTGHLDAINTICPITVDGRSMLASGGQDRTVKVWDLESRSLFLSIPVHHPVLACVEVSALLFVGLTAGSLAVDVNIGGNDALHLPESGPG